jgi:hypothetical protein
VSTLIEPSPQPRERFQCILAEDLLADALGVHFSQFSPADSLGEHLGHAFWRVSL